MSRVVLSPHALADLEEIGRSIARDNPSAARKWIAKLRTTCTNTIGTFPECGTQCGQWLPEMRCFSVGSYVIYFKSRDPVRILRIVHGGREQENLLFEP